MQINIDHTKACFSQLGQIVHEKNINIIFLQEPLFETNAENIKVPLPLSNNYNCFYNNKFNPEAVIYANRKYKYELVTESSSENVTTVKLSTKKDSIYLCSAYCPQSDNSPILSINPGFGKLNSNKNCKLCPGNRQ